MFKAIALRDPMKALESINQTLLKTFLPTPSVEVSEGASLVPADGDDQAKDGEDAAKETTALTVDRWKKEMLAKEADDIMYRYELKGFINIVQSIVNEFMHGTWAGSGGPRCWLYRSSLEHILSLFTFSWVASG